MGKAALLFVSGFIMLGVFYALGTQRGLASTEQQLAESQHQVLARNAALAGYQKARQALLDNFATASVQPGTYESASYAVTLTRSGSVVKVTSVGKSITGEAKPVEHRVIAEIKQEMISPVATDAPSFMKYAILTDRDLTIKGNVTTDVYVGGTTRSALNANVHTNGSLNLDGNTATIRGFGTYVGSRTGKDSFYNKAFRPYYNPSSKAGYGKDLRVDIPLYDAATYASRVAVDKVDAGSVTLSGTVNTGGTRDNPYIWHIKGDLTGSGNVVVNGYVLFLVDGNVRFTGNLRAGTTGWTGADESSLGIVAGGSFESHGNVILYGQIYAASGISVMSGTPDIYGSMTTPGAFTMKGNPAIYYRPASPALTTMYNEPELKYSLLSYSEW